MATRYYWPSTGAAAASPAPGALWNSTGSMTRLPLVRTKTNSAYSTGSLIAEASNLNTYDTLHFQGVSDEALPAGDIPSQTMTGVFRCQEASISEDAYLQVRAAVRSADYSTELGELYAGHSFTSVVSTSGANNEEFPATELTRIFSVTTTLLSSVPAGAHIILEIGRRSANTSTTSRSSRIHRGDPTAGDFTLTSGQSTSLACWVEFSGDLYGAPAVPLPPRPRALSVAVSRSTW